MPGEWRFAGFGIHALPRWFMSGCSVLQQRVHVCLPVQVLVGDLIFTGSPAAPGTMFFNVTGLPSNFDVTVLTGSPNKLFPIAFLLKWQIYSTLQINVLPTASAALLSTRAKGGGVSLISTPQPALPGKPCAIMGSTPLSQFFEGTKGATIPTCIQFHSNPNAAAVRVPLDSTKLKFGAMAPMSPEASVYTFRDRDGFETLFPAKLLPAWLLAKATDQTVSQMVFSASIRRGKIVSIAPVLLIQVTAMMLPYRNTSFVGQIHNSAPVPDGVNESYWARWDIGSTFVPYERHQFGVATIQVLQGTFTNLLQGVYDADAAACQPALCSDAATCAWFKGHVGNSTELKFYWYPGMHFPLDSEIVPIFSYGASYMSTTNTPASLLSSNIDLSRKYTFYAHGSPQGTLFTYKGSFVKTAAPPQHC